MQTVGAMTDRAELSQASSPGWGVWAVLVLAYGRANRTCAVVESETKRERERETERERERGEINRAAKPFSHIPWWSKVVSSASLWSSATGEAGRVHEHTTKRERERK